MWPRILGLDDKHVTFCTIFKNSAEFQTKVWNFENVWNSAISDNFKISDLHCRKLYKMYGENKISDISKVSDMSLESFKSLKKWISDIFQNLRLSKFILPLYLFKHAQLSVTGCLSGTWTSDHQTNRHYCNNGLKLTGTSDECHNRDADTHRVHEAVLDDSEESLDSENSQMIQPWLVSKSFMTYSAILSAYHC